MSPLSLFAIMGMAIGLVVFVIGWVGRRGDNHPTCRGCHYDLSGIWPNGSASCCPECGANILSLSAVRAGFRQKRRPLIWIGVLLLLASGSGGGVVLWPTLKAVEWDRFKPDWWLVMETESDDAVVADRALRLLVGRFESDALSEGNVESLIEYGLALQEDRTREWLPAWGNLIEYAWFDGRLDEGQKALYLVNLVEFELLVNDTILVGEDVMILIDFELVRCGDRSTPGVIAKSASKFRSRFELKSALERVVISGQSSAPPDWVIDDNIYDGNRGITFWNLPAPTDGPGDYDLDFEFMVTGVFLDESEPNWANSRYLDDPANTVISVPLFASFRIVEASDLAEGSRPDPILRDSIAKAISLRKCKIQVDAMGIPQFSGELGISEISAMAFFEVLLRDENDREWWIESILIGDNQSCNLEAALPGFTGGPVDLIFRSSMGGGMGENAVQQIWGGEIVITDIVGEDSAAESASFENADDH